MQGRAKARAFFAADYGGAWLSPGRGGETHVKLLTLRVS
jgi:hypothetical protein